MTDKKVNTLNLDEKIINPPFKDKEGKMKQYQLSSEHLYKPAFVKTGQMLSFLVPPTISVVNGLNELNKTLKNSQTKGSLQIDKYNSPEIQRSLTHVSTSSFNLSLALFHFKKIQHPEKADYSRFSAQYSTASDSISNNLGKIHARVSEGNAISPNIAHTLSNSQNSMLAIMVNSSRAISRGVGQEGSKEQSNDNSKTKTKGKEIGR